MAAPPPAPAAAAAEPTPMTPRPVVTDEKGYHYRWDIAVGDTPSDLDWGEEIIKKDKRLSFEKDVRVQEFDKKKPSDEVVNLQRKPETKQQAELPETVHQEVLKRKKRKKKKKKKRRRPRKKYRFELGKPIKRDEEDEGGDEKKEKKKKSKKKKSKKSEKKKGSKKKKSKKKKKKKEKKESPEVPQTPVSPEPAPVLQRPVKPEPVAAAPQEPVTLEPLLTAGATGQPKTGGQELLWQALPRHSALQLPDGQQRMVLEPGTTEQIVQGGPGGAQIKIRTKTEIEMIPPEEEPPPTPRRGIEAITRQGIAEHFSPDGGEQLYTTSQDNIIRRYAEPGRKPSRSFRRSRALIPGARGLSLSPDTRVIRTTTRKVEGPDGAPRMDTKVDISLPKQKPSVTPITHVLKGSLTPSEHPAAEADVRYETQLLNQLSEMVRDRTERELKRAKRREHRDQRKKRREERRSWRARRRRSRRRRRSMGDVPYEAAPQMSVASTTSVFAHRRGGFDTNNPFIEPLRSPYLEARDIVPVTSVANALEQCCRMLENVADEFRIPPEPPLRTATRRSNRKTSPANRSKSREHGLTALCSWLGLIESGGRAVVGTKMYQKYLLDPNHDGWYDHVGDWDDYRRYDVGLRLEHEDRIDDRGDDRVEDREEDGGLDRGVDEEARCEDESSHDQRDDDHRKKRKHHKAHDYRDTSNCGEQHIQIVIEDQTYPDSHSLHVNETPVIVNQPPPQFIMQQHEELLQQQEPLLHQPPVAAPKLQPSLLAASQPAPILVPSPEYTVYSNPHSVLCGLPQPAHGAYPSYTTGTISPLLHPMSTFTASAPVLTHHSRTYSEEFYTDSSDSEGEVDQSTSTGERALTASGTATFAAAAPQPMQLHIGAATNVLAMKPAFLDRRALHARDLEAKSSKLNLGQAVHTYDQWMANQARYEATREGRRTSYQTHIIVAFLLLVATLLGFMAFVSVYGKKQFMSIFGDYDMVVLDKTNGFGNLKNFRDNVSVSQRSWDLLNRMRVVNTDVPLGLAEEVLEFMHYVVRLTGPASSKDGEEVRSLGDLNLFQPFVVEAMGSSLLNLSSDPVVLLQSSDYVSGLIEVIRITPPHISLNYLGHVLTDHLRVFILSEGSERKSRARVCLHTVEQALPSMVHYAAYLKFRSTLENLSIRNIIDDLKHELMTAIAKVSWMDVHTKSQVLRRLTETQIQAFFPHWMSNAQLAREMFAGLPGVSPGQALLSYQAMREHEFHVSLSEPWDRNDVWRGSVFDTGCFLESNNVYFPISLLNVTGRTTQFFLLFQIPRIGARLVGCLLRAALQGAANDDERATRWSQPSRQNYRAREDCFRARHADWTAGSDDRSRIRQHALLRDVTETAAIRPVLKLYKMYIMSRSRHRTDYRFQNAEGISTNQLFYVYYAASMCRAGGKSGMAMSGASAQMSVNWALMDDPEFESTFGCSQGTGMNPATSVSRPTWRLAAVYVRRTSSNNWGSQGRFCCRFCEYRTTLRTSLTKHERAHTGERPNGCAYILSQGLHAGQPSGDRPAHQHRGEAVPV
ncbi:hypothetical protein HPB47_026668 [Ixodes persulcatus]|uniref:Uncharacterized protein n=1 Tax=Ixodes persulcatus TaxID=34615 RepID=A0AC60Q016_IXOPE|nr:hypothetical protein HPB47_026668 [Ixodes persulcatus]